MRALIQRVRNAAVSIDGTVVSTIGTGFLVFLGVSRDDEPADADYLVNKVSGLRVFPDPDGKMNLPILEAGGSVLVVSQFTLYGDCRRGRRPAFDRAAPPERALELYNYFVTALRRTGIEVKTGVFQAHMEVSLVNQGPVTIWIDSEERTKK